jgi:hypothetical protein
MRAALLLPVALVIAGCMPTPIDYEDTTPNNDACEVKMQDIWITDEQSIQGLPYKCFTVPEHTVYVQNSDRVDLAGLADLREAKNLRIEGNTLLQSTAGLMSVRVKGELVVADNPQLQEVVGLGPTEILEKVTISRNPSLRYINGLENVKGISFELRIEGASNLDSLDGLGRLEEVGAIFIRNTTGLGWVGLNNVNKVLRQVVIEGTDMGQLKGFAYLSEVGGDFIIDNNPSMTRANGPTAQFRAVAGSLSITNNESLSDTQDFQNLTMIGAGLDLTHNPQLSRCRADDLRYYIEDINEDLIDVGDNSPNWDPCY